MLIIDAVLLAFALTVSLSSPAVAADQEPERVKAARDAHETALIERADELGITWPPHNVYLRAFKREMQLEAWVANQNGEYVLFDTYAICGETGTLGPKVEEGDLQMPEGFYVITKLIPWGLGHLSLKVDYPNDADRARTSLRATTEKRAVSPGGGIEIHGTCISIGCLAIDTEPIEKIYLLVLAPRLARRAIPLHIFPGRFDDPSLFALAPDEHSVALWRSMIAPYFAFEASQRRVPRAWHAGRGVYGSAGM